MKAKVKNGVFIFAITMIVIGMCVCLFRDETPIYFVDPKHRDLLDLFIIIGLPTAILLTLVGLIQRGDNIWVILLKSGSALTLALIVLAFLAISMTLDLCTRSDPEPIFEKKSAPTKKVVVMKLECGAVSDNVAIVSAYESTPFAPLFVKLIPVDTDKLDRSQWWRVRKRSE